MSTVVEIRPFVEADAEAVVALWESEGLTRPWNDPWADVCRKQAVQPELFFVAQQAERITGVVMAGYDGHRGWIYYLAVSSAHRGRGVGRRLMEHAERALEAQGCPKVQLQVRIENSCVAGFYERLGYSPYETINLAKRLISDA